MIKSIKDIPWECGKGWWPMIEKVASAIDSFNAANPETPIEVSQIKQEFGRLRIYHHTAPENIRQLIDAAIEASWHTCERCGATEGVTTNLEGYRLTLCPNCRKEIKPRTTIRKRIVHRQK
jgi:DNA-directed RNA polymerase subunit RPC12/RpoP